MKEFFKKSVFAVLIMGFGGALCAQQPVQPMSSKEIDQYTTPATMPNVAYDRITIERQYRGIEHAWQRYQAGWEQVLFNAKTPVIRKEFIPEERVVYTLNLPQGHYLNQYIQAFPEGQGAAAAGKLDMVAKFVASKGGHIIKVMLLNGNYRDFIIAVYYSGPGPLGKQVNSMFPLAY